MIANSVFISPALIGAIFRDKSRKKVYRSKLFSSSDFYNDRTWLHHRKRVDGKQCDKIWPIVKVLGDDFSFKSSPNICWHFGYFEKDHCLIKNYFDYFLGTFRETWAIFILTSGHTDRKSPKLRSTVPHNQCGQIICSLFGQLGSNFCKLLNKCSKDCQIDYNFCQSGEISPNPVTLPIINITDMRIDLTTFE